MAGRPKGSTNDRLWRDALRKIACEYAEGEAGPKKIELVARKLIDAAMAGDISAAREFGDRLDGKPQQAVVGGGEDDPAIRVITEIRRSIVDPRHTDG